MKKRILAAFLTITMFLTCNGTGFSAYAQEPQDNHRVQVSEQAQMAFTESERDTENAPLLDYNDMEIEGTSSVGSLISKTLQTEGLDEQEDSVLINSLSIQGMTATVEYQTDRNSLVIVAVYSEDGMQLLASGQAEVSSEEKQAEIELETEEMPEYFLAKAFLLDAETMEPLCKEETTELYTREMQELLRMTTEDFAEERVLNLDEDEQTNFLVFKEDTLMVEQQGTQNRLTDNEDGTYTIQNADSSIKGMTVGEVFTYECTDGTELIIKVAAIHVSGNNVTITEDAEVSLEDAFEYVKIESDGTDDQITVDNTELEDGVTYVGKSDREDSFFSPASTDINVGGSGEWNYDIKKREIHNKNENITGELAANIGIGLKANLKIYLAKKQKFVEFKLEVKGKFTASMSGSVEAQIPLGNYTILSVPSVKITITPAVVFRMEGELTFEISMTAAVGFKWSEGSGFEKILEKPEATVAKIDIEADIFMGFSLNPKLDIINKKIAEASLTAEAGIEMTCEATIDEDIVASRHDCAVCIGGEIHDKVKAEASIKFLNNEKKKVKATILDLKFKLSDWHFSLSRAEFGLNKCPHIAYLVNATVTDRDGKVWAGAEIHGTGLDANPVTDSKGKVSFFLYNGTYLLWVSDGVEQTKKKLEVEDERTSVKLSMKNAYVAEGSCGDNLTWKFTAEGTLAISGKGEMQLWNSIEEVPWHTYRDDIINIKIENRVKSISAYAFYGCENVKMLVIPDCVKSIGDGAFAECTGLETITLGKGVNWIGYCAFEACSNVKTMNVDCNVGIENSYCSQAWHFAEVLNVGRHVRSLNEKLFLYADELGEINVNADNRYYSSEGGVLYNKDKTKLIRCPINYKENSYIILNGVREVGQDAFSFCLRVKEVKLPASLKVIGKEAFLNCHSLEKIVIPNGVDTIGICAISACEQLEEVTIPGSVEIIEIGAFESCDRLKIVTIGKGVKKIKDGAFGWNHNLTDVYFTGTSVEWSQIEIEWGNEDLTDATLHFDTPLVVPISSGDSVDVPEAAITDEQGETTSIDSSKESHETATQKEESVVEKNTVEDPESTTAEVFDVAPMRYFHTPSQHSEGQEKMIFSTPVPTNLSIGLTNISQQALFYGDTIADNGMETAFFDELVPGAEYVFAVLQDEFAEDLFTYNNLLYITQAIADQTGTLTFQYIPRVAGGTAVLYGVYNQNLADAEIVLEQESYEYDGTPQYPDVIVHYNGIELIEDEDYTLTYSNNIMPGTAQVTVQGRGDYAGTVVLEYTIGGNVGVPVTGTLTSYGTASPATVLLLSGSEEISRTQSTDGFYELAPVPSGTYTLQVSKADHVTRTYEVTVGSDPVTQDVKLCLLGDVTGDGKVNTRDLNRLYAHVNGTNALTDYELACGEVTGDGKLNTRDLNRLYAHVSGSNLLW